jgi:hypothetical protein
MESIQSTLNSDENKLAYLLDVQQRYEHAIEADAQLFTNLLRRRKELFLYFFQTSFRHLAENPDMQVPPEDIVSSSPCSWHNCPLRNQLNSHQVQTVVQNIDNLQQQHAQQQEILSNNTSIIDNTFWAFYNDELSAFHHALMARITAISRV